MRPRARRFRFLLTDFSLTVARSQQRCGGLAESGLLRSAEPGRIVRVLWIPLPSREGDGPTITLLAPLLARWSDRFYSLQCR